MVISYKCLGDIMEIFKNLEVDKRSLYSDQYFSGDYNQLIYLKRSVDDGSNKPKFYISIFTYINDELRLQGYIYFYIDFYTKRSEFIGMAVNPEYRNLNIGSLLLSSWIDICLNDGIESLDTHHKQKKPFLIHMLKTYGFEIEDISLYKKSDDLIWLYRDPDYSNQTKYLMFRSPKHENAFEKTNIFKTDNYSILHNNAGFFEVDKVIIPLQSESKKNIIYGLIDQAHAEEKVKSILSKHRR